MKTSSYIKIGIVIALSITGLVWGINYLKGHDFFKNQDSYYVVYEKIDGLQVASPVLIRGFKVGVVREIKFHTDNSGRLMVKLLIDNQIKLKKNAIAQIFSSDLMGSKSIEIIDGNTNVFHFPGDTLLPSIEGSLQEQVSLQMLPLKTQAEKLMKDMEEAIATIKYVFNETTRDNLEKSFASIKTTIIKIEHSSFLLDTIVTSQKGRLERIFANIESISNNIRINNEKISNIITNFSIISDSLRKAEISKTMIAANDALKHVELVFEKINSGQGSLGMLVNNDSLYKNLENTTRNLNALVFDLRENPKRYIHFSIFGKKDKKNKNKETSYYTIMLDKCLASEMRTNSFQNIDIQTINFKDSNLVCIGKSTDGNYLIDKLEEIKAKFPKAEIIKIYPVTPMEN